MCISADPALAIAEAGRRLGPPCGPTLRIELQQLQTAIATANLPSLGAVMGAALPRPTLAPQNVFL